MVSGLDPPDAYGIRTGFGSQPQYLDSSVFASVELDRLRPLRPSKSPHQSLVDESVRFVVGLTDFIFFPPNHKLLE